MVMVRADDEINEVKLQKLFGATQVELANNEVVENLTHAKIGYAGPHRDLHQESLLINASKP